MEFVGGCFLALARVFFCFNDVLARVHYYLKRFLFYIVKRKFKKMEEFNYFFPPNFLNYFLLMERSIRIDSKSIMVRINAILSYEIELKQ